MYSHRDTHNPMTHRPLGLLRMRAHSIFFFFQGEQERSEGKNNEPLRIPWLMNTLNLEERTKSTHHHKSIVTAKQKNKKEKRKKSKYKGQSNNNKKRKECFQVYQLNGKQSETRQSPLVVRKHLVSALILSCHQCSKSSNVPGNSMADVQRCCENNT